jgi:hypothetical protein
MSVSSASASLPPSESQSAHTNKHDNPNTHANPNVQEECLDRLKALMNEYDQLERSEDNLLELLYQLRHDDGCLVQALNDEIFVRIGGRRPFDANNTNNNNNNNNTNNNNDNSSASTAVATTTPSTKTNLGLLPEVPLLMSQLENETKEPPRMQSGANQPQRLIARHQLQQQQQQKPVEPSIDVVAAAAAPITMGPSKRRKRGHTGATTQQPSPPPFKLHNARHLEANRHVQRREERVLARRKLEDALFADEDGDDDDDNSSSPSSPS